MDCASCSGATIQFVNSRPRRVSESPKAQPSVAVERGRPQGNLRTRQRPCRWAMAGQETVPNVDQPNHPNRMKPAIPDRGRHLGRFLPPQRARPQPVGVDFGVRA